jgi:hypothetical protein
MYVVRTISYFKKVSPACGMDFLDGCMDGWDGEEDLSQFNDEIYIDIGTIGSSLIIITIIF